MENFKMPKVIGYDYALKNAFPPPPENFWKNQPITTKSSDDFIPIILGVASLAIIGGVVIYQINKSRKEKYNKTN